MNLGLPAASLQYLEFPLGRLHLGRESEFSLQILGTATDPQATLFLDLEVEILLLSLLCSQGYDSPLPLTLTSPGETRLKYQGEPIASLVIMEEQRPACLTPRLPLGGGTHCPTLHPLTLLRSLSLSLSSGQSPN